jgi:hypothetical protein
MPTWMCANCDDERGLRGKRFEADEPVCPCGVDGRLAEFKHLIAPVEIHHYDPPHPVVKGRGTHQAACGLGRIGSRVKGQLVWGTGERLVVNCKACRESEAFKSDREHTGILIAADQ